MASQVLRGSTGTAGRVGNYVYEKLSNGIQLACLAQPTPAAKVTAIFNAGSRYEINPEEKGLTHLLRRSFGLSNEKHSALHTVRSLSQDGCELKIEGTREHQIYSLTASPEKIVQSAEILGEAVTRTLFYAWEVEEIPCAYLKRDTENLNRRNFELKLMELLHAAAFRSSGLGNSLFCRPHNIGSHSIDTIQQFLSRRFTSNNLTLVGSGVDMDALTHIAQSSFHVAPNYTEGEGSPPASGAAPKFQAFGDARHQLPMDTNYIAVGWRGFGVRQGEQEQRVVALALLITAMGHQSLVRGAEAQGGAGLLRAQLDRSSGVPRGEFGVGGFNCAYADTGLVGFELGCYAPRSEALLKAMKAGVMRVGSEGVSEAQLKAAKQILKVEVAGSNRGERVATNLALLGGSAEWAMCDETMAKLIDSVTVADVKKVAGEVFSGPCAMSVVGTTEFVPYLDEI